MATASEQLLIDQGVDPNFIASERLKGKSGLLHGQNVDPQDTAGILAAFKALGGPYTVQNINGVAVAPTPRPNLSDPMALRDFYLNELGVPAASSAVQTLTGQLNQFDTATEESLNAIENQPLRMGVITGEQAATARSAATTRGAIARELLAKQSFLDAARQEANTKFDIANSERNTLQQMIIQSGGKAGITYADTVDQAAKKLGKYNDKVEKEAKKTAEKDALKNLALQVGISTKNKKGGSLSSSELRSALEKAAKKNSDLKDTMDNLDVALKKKQLNAPYSGGGSDAQVLAQNKSALQDNLQYRYSQRAAVAGQGWDGYLDPNDWSPLWNAWKTAGGDAASFYQSTVKADGKSLINPIDFKNLQ